MTDNEMTFEEASKSIKQGNLTALRTALDEGMDANLSNRFGWTLLMTAAIEGVISVGSLLIAAGADCNRANNFGDTALTLASHNAHPRFVKLLLERGAYPVPSETWEAQKG